MQLTEIAIKAEITCGEQGCDATYEGRVCCWAIGSLQLRGYVAADVPPGWTMHDHSMLCPRHPRPSEPDE